MRRTESCINCGEIREIAAHGLCFACYRRKERADDRRYSEVDRHAPGIRREHKKLLRGFAGVMSGLGDLGISSDDVITIRRTIEPYLGPIAKFLVVTAELSGSNVNSEQKSPAEFTVHPSERPSSPVDATANGCGEQKSSKKLTIRTHDIQSEPTTMKVKIYDAP